MTVKRPILALILALACADLPGCAARAQAPPVAAATAGPTQRDSLEADIDRLLDDPLLERALVAIRIESVRDGRVLYTRNAGMRVIPASSLKIVTAAVAAEQLGWSHQFETRLDISGVVRDGVLHGDLVVVGSGDPTITAQDLRTAPLFEEWADALRRAGISRVDGRLIGDDNAFDDEPLGAGWAWDYLTAAYAAPSGALSYNDNTTVVQVAPGASVGAPATVHIAPAGHGLDVVNHVTTTAPGTLASLVLERLPGSSTLTLRGQLPAGGLVETRTTTIVNPTLFLVEAMRLTFAARGIGVSRGAWDIDDVYDVNNIGRRTLTTHTSEPLSSIVGQMLKTSQNYYGEMLFKAIGRTAEAAGSTERSRITVRNTLDKWDMPADSLVMYDGSGLSRYNYVTTDLLVAVLRRAWNTPALRGPFVAALPVGGHDGTLSTRMTARLSRHVQAKTGTIANVRALAGFADTAAGDKLAFAMIANHFVAPNAQIDAVMERILERLVE